MTVLIKKLLNSAKKLKPTERAELIEGLFHSFDYKGRSEIDALWAKEAEERIDAFDQGKIEAINADDVFNEIDKG